MDINSLSKQVFSREKKIVVILALLSFLFIAYDHMRFFISVSMGIDTGLHFNDLTFPSPRSFLYMLFSILPCASFLVYLIFFRTNPKFSFFVPSIFGLLALGELYSLISNDYGEGFLSFVSVMTSLAFITFCILSGVDALKGLNKKIFVLIAMIIGVAATSLSLLSLLRSLEYYFRYDLILLFSLMTGNAGTIAFFIAFFLFCRDNCIAPVIKPTSPAVNMGYTPTAQPMNNQPYSSQPMNSPIPTSMTSEEKLAFLKDQLDRGLITREVYEAQVAEVITQL